MATGSQLRLAVAQPAVAASLAANRDKIVDAIAAAAASGCRVVVFPEGALGAPADTPGRSIAQAVAAIGAAAGAHRIHVVLGLLDRRSEDEPLHNRLLVFDDRGRTQLAYDKLWGDARFQRLPLPFAVDGVAMAATICADRWIRAVEELPVALGARVLIECSNNHAVEWVEDLGWYWQQPRALRNGVFVVLANTAPGGGANLDDAHGHSAVVAPDGRLLQAAGAEADRLLVADLDLAEATAREATRRHHHPALRSFWRTGTASLAGGRVAEPLFTPPVQEPVAITLAAAQIACAGDVATNLERIEAAMADAHAAGADLVALPELALTGADAGAVRALDAPTLERALARLALAAQRQGIAVAFGAPTPLGRGRFHNSAYVLGPDGRLLTRYDQLRIDRPELFEPGLSTAALWFELRGARGVVTLGADALWSELAELAALAGAGLHVHLANAGAEGSASRRQLWANLASYYTFTATVNAAAPASGGSTLWHDFRPTTNHRREIDGRVLFSAHRLATAGSDAALLVARQTLPRENLAHRAMTAITAPVMRPWYDAGARAIVGDPATPAGETM